jgi:YVTN family beta-propeller protein
LQLHRKVTFRATVTAPVSMPAGTGEHERIVTDRFDELCGLRCPAQRGTEWSATCTVTLPVPTDSPTPRRSRSGHWSHRIVERSDKTTLDRDQGNRTVALFILTSVMTSCSGEPPAPTVSAAPPVPSARIGSAGTLFITNEISGDLSIVDVANQRVTATIQLGKRPRGVRLSPDGSLLYVALSGSPIAGPGVDESKLRPPDRRADGIGVVDVKAQRLLKILPGGSDPEQSAVSQDGKRLFIANEDAAQVTVMDAESGDVVTTIKVGGEPEGVNLQPDGKAVWVTSEEDSAVFLINMATPRLLRQIKVGPRPRSTTFLPDGSRAYVPSENGADVRVIDTKTQRACGHHAHRRTPAADERRHVTRWPSSLYDHRSRQDGRGHRHCRESARGCRA